MRWALVTLVLIVALLLASGCAFNPIGGLVVTRGQKERELAALATQYEGKIAAARAEAAVATKQVLADKDAQMTGAANSFYGSGVVFGSILTPTRTDLLFNNLAKEGWAAIGNRQPTVEGMQAMNVRLKAELDETKTSLSQLQSSHQAALAQNTALAEATRKHEVALAAAEAHVAAVEAEKGRAISAKQSELIAVQGKLIATEKGRADERAAQQAQLAKLSWGAGILAALCLAGAIWSPVFKRELGIGAIVLGLAAVSIPFVEGWMVIAGVGLALAAVVVWAARKHHIEGRAATGVYRAVQAIKDSSKDQYDAILKPKLDQWLTVYDRNGKPVPDATAQRHIDQRLMEVGDR